MRARQPGGRDGGEGFGGGAYHAVPGRVRAGRSDWADQGAAWEYRVLTLPTSTSRSEATRLLTEQAEYGRWELARTRLFAGGLRKVWLRRKIIRVRSTLAGVDD
ncbi:DUF5703 family protein [Cellulomonas endophytica]|uniref:DUF5703 family protein n=1 Tax=Cellulomonas endophytica TaxID=2494735 RepID=UPI001011D9E4|nr:DUF5703 family protein [Cellulomonas endophytica]